MTRVGLQAEEPAQMGRALRQKMFEHHPDRNPNGDPELYNAAATLKHLIDQGMLSQYEQVLNELRRRDDNGAKKYTG